MKRIRVGGLFDGETFRDDPVILTFEDGRITDIAWKARGRVDLDFENAFAMPGLIDCHAHLTLPGDDATTKL
jgi:imidazolonepropionase-like amidohydrolase